MIDWDDCLITGTYVPTLKEYTMTTDFDNLRETALLLAKSYKAEDPDNWTDEELMDFCESLGYHWNLKEKTWERPADASRRGRTFQAVSIDMPD